jgi:hypothetical protein
MLKLINENIAHAGDKLIKSKCIQLINKGPQFNSGSGGGSGLLSTSGIQPQSEQPQNFTNEQHHTSKTSSLDSSCSAVFQNLEHYNNISAASQVADNLALDENETPGGAEYEEETKGGVGQANDKASS